MASGAEVEQQLNSFMQEEYTYSFDGMQEFCSGNVIYSSTPTVRIN
jgi:hypothetical protein